MNSGNKIYFITSCILFRRLSRVCYQCWDVKCSENFIMGVNGGPGVWRRLKEAYSRNWPWSRSTSSRDGSGTVIFASTREVLTFVYRPNLSVRVSCIFAFQRTKLVILKVSFGRCLAVPMNIYISDLIISFMRTHKFVYLCNMCACK